LVGQDHNSHHLARIGYEYLAVLDNATVDLKLSRPFAQSATQGHVKGDGRIRFIEDLQRCGQRLLDLIASPDREAKALVPEWDLGRPP
jgi:hypothetical protein